MPVEVLLGRAIVGSSHSGNRNEAGLRGNRAIYHEPRLSILGSDLVAQQEVRFRLAQVISGGAGWVNFTAFAGGGKHELHGGSRDWLTVGADHLHHHRVAE